MATSTAKEKKAETLKRGELMSGILAQSPSFITLDIETSGLSPDKGGFIIELAGVKVVNGEIVERFTELIHPGVKIYAKTTELTGITNEMLVGKPAYGQVLPRFHKFIGNLPVVAHNSMFDWDRFLLHYFKKVGIIAKNQVVDTLALAKMYYPERKSYKLQELCTLNGIVIESHHRALDDAEATAKLAILFQKQFANSVVVGDLFTEPQAFHQAEPTPTPKTSFRIKRAKYWEKEITKKKKMQRIYVQLSIGNVYFDIPTQTWYNKDVKESLDFEALQEAVLKHLNIPSVLDLCFFRN